MLNRAVRVRVRCRACGITPCAWSRTPRRIGSRAVIPKTLMVDGVTYKLLDYLGWQPSAGMYAAEVETPTGPRKVVKSRGGSWRFWTVADRVA